NLGHKNRTGRNITWVVLWKRNPRGESCVHNARHLTAFDAKISTLVHTGHKCMRAIAEIRSQLLNHGRIRRKNQLLMNGIGLPGIDNLYAEFAAHLEIVRRIGIASRVRLVDEPALLSVVTFDNRAAGQYGFNKLTIAIDAKIHELG